MGKDMTKLLKEPLEDYRLQAEFQRRLAQQPFRVRERLKAMGKCCRKLIPGTGTVDVTRTLKNGKPVRAGFHGVCRCNNLWACPVCSARHLTEKCKQLTDLLERLSADYSAFMITYTVPHTRRYTAENVIETFKQVHRKGLHGTPEKFKKNELKTLGTVTTSEVTVTPYGFHYHQHVLYIVPKSSWDKVEQFFAYVEAGWNKALIMTLEGFDPATARTPAVKLSRNKKGEVLQVTDARYLYGYGVELTKSERHHKRLNGVRGSRTLFDLITGTDEDFDLLCEWLLASRGKHRIRMSDSVTALLDKPLACEKKTTDDIETGVVGSFTASGWHNLIEAEIVTGLPLRHGVAKAALDGYDSVVKFLARYGLEKDFLPPFRIFSKSPAPDYEEIARDWEIRKRRQRSRYRRAKDASIHDKIIESQMTAEEIRERNLKAWRNQRAWYEATYRNSACFSE